MLSPPRVKRTSEDFRIETTKSPWYKRVGEGGVGYKVQPTIRSKQTYHRLQCTKKPG